ncbi:unnamed protein product [Notodromas monacha]|uniref:Uncharacterized protein n=1 Tax=Notodromas monacha TaxID=399045 RepID=A0A7R9GFD0_9CRUS|nr:unnamed protein product [Notodromas monacha]CAG0919222.1 unnamed protein product [Notodromas monacha]
MEFLTNPWKGRQKASSSILPKRNGTRDGTDALSKIVASVANKSIQNMPCSGQSKEFLTSGMLPIRHEMAPPHTGLIPISVPVPASCVTPRLLPENNSPDRTKTQFMFAVALSMEQTEDANGATRETFALTTTLKESFGKYLALPFRRASSTTATRSNNIRRIDSGHPKKPKLTHRSTSDTFTKKLAPNRDRRSLKQKLLVDKKESVVRKESVAKTVPSPPPPPPPLPPQDFGWMKPKHKKLPVVHPAKGAKVVERKEPMCFDDELIKNVPLLEPFAVSEGDPFHYQILGMQDALMDITEEIGRIFGRESLTIEIVKAEDSVQRSILISKMQEKNQKDLNRMSKSLELFRWLLIQILTKKYRDSNQKLERSFDKYEITSLAQWFRLASISEVLIDHCGRNRDSYSSQLENLLKFVNEKLGHPGLSQTQGRSWNSTGIPKIGFMSVGSLKKNAVLEKMSGGNVKAPLSRIVRMSGSHLCQLFAHLGLSLSNETRSDQIQGERQSSGCHAGANPTKEMQNMPVVVTRVPRSRGVQQPRDFREQLKRLTPTLEIIKVVPKWDNPRRYLCTASSILISRRAGGAQIPKKPNKNTTTTTTAEEVKSVPQFSQSFAATIAKPEENLANVRDACLGELVGAIKDRAARLAAAGCFDAGDNAISQSCVAAISGNVSAPVL